MWAVLTLAECGEVESIEGEKPAHKVYIRTFGTAPLCNLLPGSADRTIAGPNYMPHGSS